MDFLPIGLAVGNIVFSISVCCFFTGEVCACDTTDGTLRTVETNITGQQHFPIMAILPGDTDTGGSVEYCLGPLSCVTGKHSSMCHINLNGFQFITYSCLYLHI